MKNLNDWLAEGYKAFMTPEMIVAVSHQPYDRRMQNCWPVSCADGFKISIQASHSHYCKPRRNFDTVESHDELTQIIDYSIYESFELGFPNMLDESILPYAEDLDNPTETLYGWVPREVVEKMLADHGGIVNIFSSEYL